VTQRKTRSPHSPCRAAAHTRAVVNDRAAKLRADVHFLPVRSGLDGFIELLDRRDALGVLGDDHASRAGACSGVEEVHLRELGGHCRGDGGSERDHGKLHF